MSEKTPPDNDRVPKPRRRQTRFLKRHIVASDNHGFVGRLYDLGIVSLNFSSYDELVKYPDIKYVIDTLNRVEALTSRVESLNLAGNLLWPDPMPEDFKKLPVTRYEWLTIAADLFIVRHVSVIDCALLLINQVLQIGLKDRDCTLYKLSKNGMPAGLGSHLAEMLDEQFDIRAERNMRVHHGLERSFTDDDVTFKTASLFTDRGNGMIGRDYFDRPINLDISFREGLVWLQKDFNRHTKKLLSQLDIVYDLLIDEFEDRFGPLVAAATHGLNAGVRRGSTA